MTGAERPHAIITGGSSGIGLAAAKILASRGHAVTLIARNREKLADAEHAVRAAAGETARVRTFSADVRDAEALGSAIESSVSDLGRPFWAISSAGIVSPGTFMTQTLGDHENQWRTNYQGSLHFAHLVVPHLVKLPGSKLVFISSGAAFVGLYGYSSYGPTKFAVRGLAESLRVELKPRRVSVTVAFPGDTDTPQLRWELPRRPSVTNRLAGGSGVMNPDVVALHLVNAAGRGDFQVTFSWQLRILGMVHSLIAPLLRAYQDWLVKRFGE